MRFGSPPADRYRIYDLTVLAKVEARRVRTVALSDIEMRRDFQAIITDWRDRAKNYLSTYSECRHYGRNSNVGAQCKL